MSEVILQSVENALNLMEVLAEEDSELGVSELSRKLGLGKSTTHRLLMTLESRGFIEQNQTTGKYKLGIKIMQISASVMRQFNIIKICKPYLQDLSHLTGEAAHLCLYSNGEIIFVDKINGKNSSKMQSIIGATKPAYTTAAGKALLAELPPLKIEEYLRKTIFKAYTPYTIIEKEKIKEELTIIRKQGYSEDRQECEEGLVCYAAPIKNHFDEVIAAISVSGAASRMNERKEDLIAQVTGSAAKISEACGFGLRA